MIVTTTPTIDGYRITGYYGIVFGEVITGINFLKDFGAGIRNLVGGRSAGYEEELMAGQHAHGNGLRHRRHRGGGVGAKRRYPRSRASRSPPLREFKGEAIPRTPRRGRASG